MLTFHIDDISSDADDKLSTLDDCFFLPSEDIVSFSDLFCFNLTWNILLS